MVITARIALTIRVVILASGALATVSGFINSQKFNPINGPVHRSRSRLCSGGQAECDILDLDVATRNFVKRGQPSSPGWKNPSRFDRLTEWVTCDEANRPIICEYDPDAIWLWTKWRGTALSITFIPVILNVSLGIAVDQYVHHVSEFSWSFFAVPPIEDPLIQELVGMKTLWEYQLTLCTFILAFFTSQAYSFWRSVYFTTRAIQGRINDICLLTTVSAERGTVMGLDETFTGFSEDASDLVQTCTRLIRLSHTFFWASTPTCSNGFGDGGVKDGDENRDFSRQQLRDNPIEIGPILLSPEGLKSLEDLEELTSNEVEALLTSGIPPSQYPYVLLEWVGLYIRDGLRSGILHGGNGMEENLLRQITSLRAEYFSIGDYVSGMLY
jgi:hypothetical protein